MELILFKKNEIIHKITTKTKHQTKQQKNKKTKHFKNKLKKLSHKINIKFYETNVINM